MRDNIQYLSIEDDIEYITLVIYPIFNLEIDRFLPFYTAMRYCPKEQWSVLSNTKLFIIC